VHSILVCFDYPRTRNEENREGLGSPFVDGLAVKVQNENVGNDRNQYLDLGGLEVAVSPRQSQPFVFF
jgi:hypothetical protein